MDLGSTICLPRHPTCTECPVAARCLARAQGTVFKRPTLKPLPPKPDRHAGGAVIRKNGSVFVRRRPPRGLLGGLWDFPSVVIATPSEAPAALEASLASEWGLSISVGKRLQSVQQVFSHFRLRLELHEAQWQAGSPQHKEPWKWARTKDLHELAFPVSQHRLISDLSETLRS